MLEPVQGEGGFIPMPPDYPARLLELCREHGILYVDDEVQSGVGRTGKMWAVEHYDGVEPDLLVSGKSLGGGLPLAAVTGRAELMDAVPPGGLGGTFGGNPLACAAAVAVLDAVREPEFLERATSAGAHDPGASRRVWRRAGPRSARCAGSARCSPSSSRSTTPDRAQAIVVRGVRARPALACLRHVRQCHPSVGTADDLGRRARRGHGASRGEHRRCVTVTELPDIRIRGLRKRYGDVAAVDGIELDIEHGEFFTMLGPSGSGKTTTLRMIAGFETPDEGTIELAGEDVSRLPPYDRPVNTVFQDYALFPHMTVQENVEYGLRVKKVPKDERRARARARRSRWCASARTATASRPSCRVGSASVSRSRGRS